MFSLFRAVGSILFAAPWENVQLHTLTMVANNAALVVKRSADRFRSPYIAPSVAM